MKLRLFFTAGVAVSFLCSTGSSSVTAGHQLRTSDYENVLGTSLELKVLTSSEVAAERAQTAALAEIDGEAKILSAYDANSEFSQWVRTEGTPVKVSPQLFDVLNRFDQWRERTGGALDASAETVVRIWKQAASEKR